MAKTTSERIEAVKLELEQKENLLKQLMQKEKEAVRKARTKRLIEHGAILESLIADAETLTNDQIQTILERTVGSSYGAKTIDSVRGQVSAVSAQRAEVTQDEGG